jgi:hypothetical protein
LSTCKTHNCFGIGDGIAAPSQTNAIEVLAISFFSFKAPWNQAKNPDQNSGQIIAKHQSRCLEIASGRLPIIHTHDARLMDFGSSAPNIQIYSKSLLLKLEERHISAFWYHGL